MGMLRVTGLWEGKTKAGEWQLSGSLGGVRVLIMKVRERRGEKSPSHVLLFADAQGSGGGASAGDQAGGGNEGHGGYEEAPF